MSKKTIGVIGAGKMGSALAIPLKNRGFDVVATRRSVKKMKELSDLGIEITSNNRSAVQKSDVVIFSLKPWDTVEQMQKLRSELEGKMVISICASLPISKMEAILPNSTIIRTMTNVASKYGSAFTIYSISKKVSQKKEEEAQEILDCFGTFEKIEEKYMDPLTPISGSGPAYLFTVMESMVYAGLKVGVPRDLALRASHQAVLASAKLVEDSDATLSELRETFITPGGVTIEALYELENSGIKAAFMKAIEAASDKAKKSSEEFMEKMDGMDLEIEEEN